jgi:hypothetical protein
MTKGRRKAGEVYFSCLCQAGWDCKQQSSLSPVEGDSAQGRRHKRAETTSPRISGKEGRGTLPLCDELSITSQFQTYKIAV